MFERQSDQSRRSAGFEGSERDGAADGPKTGYVEQKDTNDPLKCYKVD